MNIIQAIDDPLVFGPFFRSGTWKAWRVFLKASFAVPMTPDQLAIYQQQTGRTTPPTSPLNEAWLVCGRRGGKRFVLSTVAVFLACFHDWRPFLGPGEIATVMIVARDRRQARVIKRFIVGLLRSVEMLRGVIEDETAERVELKNRVVIEIHTASFRSTRGYTIVCALLDEIAFWPQDDAAEPDIEVINAIRPGMATVPGAMLLCASIPLCTARCVVERAPSPFRSGRRSGSGLAGRYAHHEPERAVAGDRRGDGGRSGERRRRVWRAVPG